MCVARRRTVFKPRLFRRNSYPLQTGGLRATPYFVEKRS